MNELSSFVVLVVLAGVMVGAVLVVKRFPVLGLLVAMAPASVMFLGLLAWLVTDYFRIHIPDFKADPNPKEAVPELAKSQFLKRIINDLCCAKV